MITYILSLILLLVMFKAPSAAALTKSSDANSSNYISHFKAGTMYLTLLSILAVDFTAFPRRFAKTEVWGTSVMDAGVGATVFGMGLSLTVRVKRKESVAWKWFFGRMLPVMVLGLGRALAVKCIGYQVFHVDQILGTRRRVRGPLEFLHDHWGGHDCWQVCKGKSDRMHGHVLIAISPVHAKSICNCTSE